MRRTFRLLSLVLVCCAFISLAPVITRRTSGANQAVVPAANFSPVPATTLATRSSTYARVLSPLRHSPETTATENVARNRLAGELFPETTVFEPAPHNAAGVQFVAHARDMTVELADNGINVTVTPQDRATPADRLSIRVRGNEPFAWQGQDKANGETNYFIGNDPKQWRTHVSRYSRAETSDEHPVSLSVYDAGENDSANHQNRPAFEYDIRTTPGADASKVRLELRGAKDLRIDHEGDLVMRVGARELRMNAPAIYEQVSATTTTGTRKKSTSSSHKRQSTSSHSTPRGARRETMPRKSQGSSANSQRSRLRKSMHDDPHAPRKKRSAKTLKKLPLGDDSPPARKTLPKKPKAPSSQQSRRIQGGYVLEADGSVGLWIGTHDPNAALVIDPSLSLTYETFLGGAGADSVNSMTTDSAGNVYLAGTTTSAVTFPEGDAEQFGGTRGTTQLFIAKFAFASGVGTLQYLSFFGGSSTQAGGQVAVDESGNAAILGVTTSTDYPVTDGSTPTAGLTSNNGNDVVVSEVDPTGTDLIFSTLFGGSGAESQNAATGVALTSSQNIPAAAGGIAFDASGNLYIASDTTSADLPTTANSYQPSFGGSAQSDGFLAAFQPQNVASGTSDLLYCTYLGTNSDGAIAIGGVAVDAAASPNVYIAGLTDNQIDGFPVTNALQTAYAGGSSDAFLMKILPASGGSADLIYATLLGGQCMDEALGVAVDTAVPANAYVIGATQSPSFLAGTPALAGPSTTLNQPTPPPSQPCTSGTQNAFLAVVDQNAATQATSLPYFTYLGGREQDAAQSVDVVFPNSVYVGGTTTSYDFGWRDNLQAFNGSTDAFAVKLDTTKSGAASLIYATPLGGTFQTAGNAVSTLGNGIAADAQGDVYVAGETTASNFPTAVTSSREINGLQNVCGSCQEGPPLPDAFLTGIQEGTAQQPAVSFESPHLSFGSAVSIGTPAISQPIEFVNTGEAALNLSSITPLAISGINASDFSVSGTCPQQLQPSQACELTLGFTPSVAGIEAGTLSVADNAPGSPQLLELSGSGQGPLQASPGGLNFGDVAINPANPPYLTVELVPAADVKIDGFNRFPSSMSAFGLHSTGDTCASPSSQKCSIAYTFTPTTTGTFQAEIDIQYDLNGVHQPDLEIPLSGNGVAAAPIAVVTPEALDFGNVTVGSAIAPRAVSIGNTGGAPLGFTAGIGITGANASDFSESSACSSTLAPESACSVSVKFAPQSPGAKSAILTISDNASGSPQAVALSGVATAVSQIQVSPTSWGFAPESIGTQSPPETIAVTNVGSLPVDFTQNITITGANALDFSETTNCSLQSALQPSAQCAINVTFTPTASGTRAATLSVADSASSSPQTVALSGTGLQANANVSTTSLLFGNQQVGTPSAAQAVTITSVGPGQPLKIGCISIVPCGSTSDSTPQDFSETDNCSSSVTTSCAAQIVFTPACTTGALRQATLTIQDNGATPTQTVSLTGTATGDFCLAPTSGGLTDTVSAGSTATFPAISILSVGSASGAAFTGSVNLACSSAPAGPACTFSPSSSIAVSPNVPGKFEVQAATTAASSVIHNPGDEDAKPERLVWLLIGIALLLMAWHVLPRAESKRRTIFAAFALVFLCVIMGSCGGNTASVATDPPAGTATYTITVTASDGSQVQTANLQLNVTSQ